MLHLHLVSAGVPDKNNIAIKWVLFFITYQRNGTLPDVQLLQNNPHVLDFGSQDLEISELSSRSDVSINSKHSRHSYESTQNPKKKTQRKGNYTVKCNH